MARSTRKAASKKSAAKKTTRRTSTAKTSTRRKAASRRSTTAQSKRARPKTKRWSAGVMRRSDALDLESGVFTKRSPHQIALSLKRSAEHSTRRKGTPYQSAMSMLNFQINRAGKGLSAGRRRILEDAKDELRKVFDRA